jgi:hypothetical protein
MATVFEERITEDQRSGVRSLWVKWLSAKYMHKEVFPVYGRKCVA